MFEAFWSINRKFELSIQSMYPCRSLVKEFLMIIVWGGFLALMLSRFRRNPFKVTRLTHDIDAQIKRIGVYYMCIDDLPL